MGGALSRTENSGRTAGSGLTGVSRVRGTRRPPAGRCRYCHCNYRSSGFCCSYAYDDLTSGTPYPAPHGPPPWSSGERGSPIGNYYHRP